MSKFSKFSMAVLSLLLVATSASAQIDLGGLLGSMEDPSTWHYIQLTAKNSTKSGGFGDVSVAFVMPDGIVADELHPNFREMAENDPEAWEQNTALLFPYGNPAYAPDNLGDDELPYASVRGFSLIYMPGLDQPMGMAMSSYVYFSAKAQAFPGSYFAGWSYLDGGTEMGKYDDGRDLYDWMQTVDDDITESNPSCWNYDEQKWEYCHKIHTVDGVLFKILPPKNQEFVEISQGVFVPKFEEQVIYATFLPVLPTGFTGGFSEVAATAGENTEFEVVFDVEGEDIDQYDFEVPTTDGAGFEVIGNSFVDGQYHVTVRYTAQAGVEAGREYKGGLTLTSLAGPSLRAPLAVRTVPADRLDAVVSINGVETNYDWNAAVAAANAAKGKQVVLTLTKNVAESATLSNNMTLNLNGYTLTGTVAVSTNAHVTVDYSKYGGEILDEIIIAGGSKVTANGGKVLGVVVNGGATLNANGLAIQGVLTNEGTTTVTDGEIKAISSTGTLDMQGGHVTLGVNITGGKATLKRCTIDGNVTVNGAVLTTEKLAVLNGDLNVTSGSVTINCGKFVSTDNLKGAYTLKSAYFKSVAADYVAPAGKSLWNITAGVEAQQGYTYFVGDLDAATESGVSICTIGTTSYSRLEDALAFANNNADQSVTIIMQNNYTLLAGYYTLPAKATLVIPMAADQQTGYELIPRVSNNSVNEEDFVMPTEFRRLTLAAGVQLDVFGAIEASCTQLASDESYAAGPQGPYGCMELKEGAHITMQSGSELRAWGYVVGKGEIDVRRGATVREQFQMGDWKGGTTSFGMLSDPRAVFPLTTYFIQNVECMTKYHPGAVLSSTTSVSAGFGGIGITAQANDIKIIGVEGVDDAMFLMNNEDDAENTWVRKWYDVENDIQTYDVNNSAHIGSMVLELGKLGTADLVMNSATFVLPITTNMKIHLLSGAMDFTQNTSMMPGSEVEIDKESTVSITYDEENDVEKDRRYTGLLCLYDAADWGRWVYSREGSVSKQNKAVTVRYAPAYNGKPNVRDLENLPSAKINVHGTFDSQSGWVLTSEHGANIFSTNEDAGTFRFGTPSASASYSKEVWQVRGTSTYESIFFSAAQLTNGDETKVSTADQQKGTSLCYMNNRWTLMTTEDCLVVDKMSGTYYAKPQDYVALASGVEDEDTHLYYSADGDHAYILTGGDECQWWEVEQVGDNLYHSLHPQNDTYYYWDDHYEVWEEQRYTITWLNWDGDTIQFFDYYGDPIDYTVPYGTMAEYLGTNPTREPNVDYTYDFTGWQPALGPVTCDVTYTATYQATQRKYTIVFKQEGGKEIERHFLTRDEMPVCENTPVRTGYILQWEPAISAVTGDATYTATWLAEKPATWTIDWYNYDGEKLQQTEVAADATPEAVQASFTETSKLVKNEASHEYTYEFDHWTPTIAPATSNAAYTAVYREIGKKYTIRFVDEEGDLIYEGQFAYGETPVCVNAPVKAGQTLVWDPQIQTVMGNQEYEATWMANIINTPDFGFYERAVTPGNYGTICLPRRGNISGAVLFEIAYKNNDQTQLYCYEVKGMLEAGKPYIFLATADKLHVDYVDGNEELTAGEHNGLVGTFEDIAPTYNWQAEDAYMVVNNTIKAAANGSSLKANRAYIRMGVVDSETSAPAPAPGRRRVVLGSQSEQITTGMGEVNENTIGKFLINGHLYILRDGKMYDVMGR